MIEAGRVGDVLGAKESSAQSEAGTGTAKAGIEVRSGAYAGASATRGGR